MSDQMHSWNDDRLDELNRRVDNGFKAVDQRFERTEGGMKEGFAEVKGELQHLNQRFDRLLHTLMVIAWGFAGTALAALVGLVVALA